MSAIVHFDGREVKVPNSLAWPTLVILTIGLALWHFLIRPLFWWCKGFHLHRTSDEMLAREGIRDPVRERFHIFFGLLFFLLSATLAILLWYQRESWQAVALIVSLLWYAGTTVVYYRNQRENEDYPPSNAFT